MQTYTIKELSQLFQVQASTLRYYEQIGLLPAVERTENGQRIYNDSHLQRLRAIDCFKNTGLPIAKMLDFFQYETNLCCNINEIIELVTTHEENIRKQIAQMETDLLHIQQKVRFYNGIKAAIDTNQPWPDWEDYSLPEKS